MSTLSPSSFVFVVKLRSPDPADVARLCGRVEHVLSGRRHDFDTPNALLACLRHELQEVCRCDDGTAAGSPTHRT